VLSQRTFRIFLIIVGVYVLLWIPATFSSKYLDSPVGLIAAIPVLSIYLFNMLGVPGLLKNGGACGWGWCAPTVFGWFFAIIFWSIVGWLVAWGVASAFPGKSAPPRSSSSKDKA
jgi:hypothetical protein